MTPREEEYLEYAKSLEREIEKLTTDRRFELQNDQRLTYRRPPDGWVCFHCGQRFMTPGEAALHFGETPDISPKCHDDPVVQ